MAASAERVTGTTRQSHYSDLDRMLIGDSWCYGRSNRRIRDIDPYNGDTLLEMAAANEADLNEAHIAAAAAQPRCGALLPAERAAVMAREELFGPVAPIIRASDENDALRTANDTEQGLSEWVFTADLERGARFARQLKTGMAHVNDQPVNDSPSCPFGGRRTPVSAVLVATGQSPLLPRINRSPCSTSGACSPCGQAK